MFYVSEIYKTGPKKFENDLQKKTYEALESLDIPFERVDTDEAVTMDDCVMERKRIIATKYYSRTTKERQW